MTSTDQLEVNGRTYRFPRTPVVVVCVDGSEPDYHETAIRAGRMPFVAAWSTTGTMLVGESIMPSFTNPNNMSIATGVPASRHGICGNTYLDVERGVEAMMNDPQLLRVPTIFAAFERAGARVAVVTAKDKLRRLLQHGLSDSICFSAEKADTATVAENGIDDVLEFVGLPLPSVYSADLSEFVMAAGVKLLKEGRADLMYLTLTDYIQHKYAPGTDEANDFYGMLDGYLGQLDALGAVVVVTADHGMNGKATADGAPNVVYLQDLLDGWFGDDSTRVVLPVADPYTRHHGSLGSFALVYVSSAATGDVLARLVQVPGVAEVLTRQDAAERFELPADRIGDLVVIADRTTVVGTAPDKHDLSGLDRPLRSHGGLTEQRVPILVNRPLTGLSPEHRLRNFDAYWLGLNFATDHA